jgi:aspartate aminotransferase
MIPSLSQRIQTLPASSIRKYLPMVEELRVQGVTVFTVNIGQPDVATSSILFEAMKSFTDPVLGYAPSAGEDGLRQAICRYYSRLHISVSFEQVLVTIGGSEALMAAFDLTCDVGDEMIVFEPIYTNYRSIAGLKGVRMVSVSTSLEQNFALPSLSDIEAAITERTKAILICNPSNPTGSVIPRETLEALVELARLRSLFLIVDEVYREFVFGTYRAPFGLGFSGGNTT